MRKKRALIFVIAIIMLLSVFTGCSKNTNQPTDNKAGKEVKTDGKKTEEKAPDTKLDKIDVTVSVWGIGDNIVEGETDDMLDFIQDKIAINIIPVNVGWGDADEKYNVWAASNQLPDVIGGIATIGNQRYYQWIEDGVVRALPDDTSAYPDLDKYLALDEVKAYSIDGKNYFMPRMTYADARYWCMDRALIARQDWLDELNIDTPKNNEEFKAMLKKLVKADIDGNGVDDTIGITTNGLDLLSQIFTGNGYTDKQWIKDKDGKFKPGYSTEQAFKLGSFLRDLYKEGLLDPDFATSTTDIGTEKFTTGKAAIFVRQASPKHLDEIYENWVKVQDTPFWESVSVLNPPLEEGYTYFGELPFWSESYVSSSVDDEKMDRILQLYDYLYSDAGVKMGLYGFEGKDYEESDGQVKLLMGNREDGSPKSALDLYRSAKVFKMLAVWGADYMQYVNPSIPQEIRDMSTEAREYRIKEWDKPSIDYYVNAMNVEAKNDMTVDFKSSWVQFIMNTSDISDEDLFAQMLEEWNANGFSDAIDAVNEAAKASGK